MKYKELNWKKIKEDLDYEDSVEGFQKWQAEVSLVNTDDLIFTLVFMITKRNNADYFLMLSSYSKDISGLWMVQERNLKTLESAKEKAETIYKKFLDNLFISIENLEEK